MERETHTGNGQHTIDIPNDVDFPSSLSTGEETSDNGESNMGGATAHHEFCKLVQFCTHLLMLLLKICC